MLADGVPFVAAYCTHFGTHHSPFVTFVVGDVRCGNSRNRNSRNIGLKNGRDAKFCCDSVTALDGPSAFLHLWRLPLVAANSRAWENVSSRGRCCGCLALTNKMQDGPFLHSSELCQPIGNGELWMHLQLCALATAVGGSQFTSNWTMSSVDVVVVVLPYPDKQNAGLSVFAQL